MTTTTAVNAQSIGTSTNVGENLFAYKLTPQSTTDRFFIEAILTNGAGGYDVSSKIYIRYACHSVDMTAALAPPILRSGSRFLEVIGSSSAGQVTARTSLLEPLAAAYVYLWVDVPNQTVAQTITVKVIEGP